MSGRFNICFKCTVLSFFFSITPINAQLLQDLNSVKLVRKSIDYIYNLQFNDASELYTEICRLNPGHPLQYLIRGISTYWENYPLMYKTPAHTSFEEDMRQCITLSEKNNNPVYTAEYLLTNLCARAMLLMFYADNDIIIKVIPLATSSYQYVRRSFDFAPLCNDLYYFTGLYNYYREAYPKAYPVYQSLAILFPDGDIEKGLKELQSVAANSVVLRAEAYFLLAWIYLNYENNYSEALYYCKSLYELYPDNLLYRAIYIKNLLLINRYDEAEKLINAEYKGGENLYSQAQLSIVKGILQEKKYFDNDLAQQYYTDGISAISGYGKYGNEFAAYAYYGLSRISEANGDKHTSRTYRKEATKLAAFRKISFDK